MGDKLGDKGNKTSGRGAHRPAQGNKKGDKRRHLTHHPTQAHVWGDNERQWETRGDKGRQGLFSAGRATGRLPHKETCKKTKHTTHILRWNLIWPRKLSINIPHGLTAVDLRKTFTSRNCASVRHTAQIKKKRLRKICRIFKSAHTALAAKACLLGGNSYTKCSITFVNIAVAISALAGGGQKRFRTETRIRWCFRHFSRIFGCLSAEGIEMEFWVILVAFRQWKNGQKWKKHCT